MKKLLFATLCVSKLTFADSGLLNDLASTTFTCPAAGLNAAAREAKKVVTSGTYQFSYFKIITDASNAKYEVGFKSNVYDETDLNYEVTLYCQQGFDPNKNIKVELKK